MEVKRSKRGNNIRVPDGMYTISMLAEVVGVSPDTIRRWVKNGRLPYETQDNGQLTVYLFDGDAARIAKQLNGSGDNDVGLAAA